MSAPATTIHFSQRAHWAREQAISYLMAQAVENRGVLSLAAGLVDEQTLPVELCGDVCAALCGDPARGRGALQYGTTAGADALRSALVEHLAQLEGCAPADLGVTADQFVLTTGSQQLLSLVAETLFDPGDICLVAAPTYFVFLGVLNGVGARTVAVAADADGMQIDRLEQALEEIDARGELGRVKLIYVVSNYENPSGVSLAAARRQELVELAARWSRAGRILILEDAAYRELRYDGPVRPSVWSCDRERHRVILAQTFSKSFSPGVRVGWGVLPRELVGPICNRKGNEDFGSAHFNQQLVAAVLRSGRYAAHVAAVRAGYRAKRDAMLAALETHLGGLADVSWVRPEGGLYVWLTLPERVETGFESPLFRAAVQRHGVMYVPGELCYPTGSPLQRKSQMRLSFGVLDAAGVTEGIARLARAIRAAL